MAERADLSLLAAATSQHDSTHISLPGLPPFVPLALAQILFVSLVYSLLFT